MTDYESLSLGVKNSTEFLKPSMEHCLHEFALKSAKQCVAELPLSRQSTMNFPVSVLHLKVSPCITASWPIIGDMIIQLESLLHDELDFPLQGHVAGPVSVL